MSEVPASHSAVGQQLAAVRDALARHDREAGRMAMAGLVNLLGRHSAASPHSEVIELLQALLACRWFDVADMLSDPLMQRPDAPAELQRRVAQVMIERGRHLAALKCLLELRRTRRGNQPEVLGHIGRVYKQQFLDAEEVGQSEPAWLKLAAQTYWEAYQLQPERHTWHGINAVALLRRCEWLPDRGGFPAGETVRLACEVRTTLLAGPVAERTAWDWATLAEAAYALGDWQGAAEALRAYIDRADAFALGSTLRQFEQVWRIGDAEDPTSQALRDLVRAALLQKESGMLRICAADVSRAAEPVPVQYEAVFGADRFESLETYRRGLERSACVARIGRSVDTGLGTGFVLPAESLGLTGVGPHVLVTNAHVMSPDEAEQNQGALHPAEAVISFSAMPGVAADQEFTVAEVLFSSPRGALDVTVARLDAALPAFVPYPVAAVLPARTSGAAVRVIGHPSGRGLSFSVNTLLDHASPQVHYRTATEGGSSGSPVFNTEWRLIALHHVGGQAVPRLNGQTGHYPANEGIWMGAIRTAIAAARG